MSSNTQVKRAYALFAIGLVTFVAGPFVSSSGIELLGMIVTSFVAWGAAAYVMGLVVEEAERASIDAYLRRVRGEVS